MVKHIKKHRRACNYQEVFFFMNKVVKLDNASRIDKRK